MAQEVLLTLGDYQFSMDTAAHDQLQRSTSYLWKQQQRLGRDAAQQFLGKQSESIKLSGTIYPHFRGGLEQMAELREAANEGEPLGLVDGRGNNLGQWVVKQITESESNYIAEGLPRKLISRSTSSPMARMLATMVEETAATAAVSSAG